jgi:D-arabinose 1-dehydrogenase
MALHSFVLPPLDQIPDEADDAPRSSSPLVNPTLPTTLGDVGHLRLSKIIFGAGTFANQYNPDDVLESTMPFRTVRLALRCVPFLSSLRLGHSHTLHKRYGIHTFDTSPFYGPSETILGNALHALNSEFTRSSYQLVRSSQTLSYDLSGNIL